MEIVYNNAYRIAKILWIEDELRMLPKVSRGEDSGNAVIRVYDDCGVRRHIYKIKSAKGAGLAQIADRREELKGLRKRILASLKYNADPGEYHVELTAPFKIMREDWEQMRSQSNPKKIYGDYWHGNIHMRSRFEVNTAIILDKLGLEYKYEAELWINGRKIHPDFVVYLPEFGVCFIIECMGGIGSADYDSDAVNRLRLLTDGGYIPFRDFLVLGGSEHFIPTAVWVENSIIQMVNSISAECVMPVGKKVVRQYDDPLTAELPPDIAARIAEEWG